MRRAGLNKIHCRQIHAEKIDLSECGIKIPNTKHQITNKFQITVINDPKNANSDFKFWCLWFSYLIAGPKRLPLLH